MFLQLRLSQAAKEDKNSTLAQKSIIKDNDYLVNEGMGAVEPRTEVVKDKTAFSKENKVKSESILAKDDKNLVQDEKKDDKSLVKEDKSLTKDDKSLVKDDKSFVKSQESKAASDKTPPMGRQQDKGRGAAAVAKTGRIASMFEKASSPCPGGINFCSTKSYSSRSSKLQWAKWQQVENIKSNRVFEWWWTNCQVRQRLGGKGESSTSCRGKDTGDIHCFQPSTNHNAPGG